MADGADAFPSLPLRASSFSVALSRKVISSRRPLSHSLPLYSFGFALFLRLHISATLRRTHSLLSIFALCLVFCVYLEFPLQFYLFASCSPPSLILTRVPFYPLASYFLTILTPFFSFLCPRSPVLFSITPSFLSLFCIFCRVPFCGVFLALSHRSSTYHPPSLLNPPPHSHFSVSLFCFGSHQVAWPLPGKSLFSLHWYYCLPLLFVTHARRLGR